MSGFLNKKHQLIDLVVTQEGRKQMSMGGLRPTYASFSDRAVNYSILSGSTKEVASRLYFQTPSALSDDLIVFETDDKGRLLVSENDEKFSIINDDVYLLTASEGQSLDYMSVTGDQFASTVNMIKNRTLGAFKRNRMARTVSGYQSDSKKFKVNKNEHTFVISNSVPFPKGPDTESFDIDHAETFMFDSKLAHNVNFQYLPPVNTDGSQLGVYSDLRSLHRETFEEIKSNLGLNVIPEYDTFLEDNTVFNYDGDLVIKNRAPGKPYDSTVIAKEAAQIYFTQTSEFNNFIGQFYEEDPETGFIKKLDIVDAGEFFDELDSVKPYKHVYYVGKIIFDNNKIPSFVNIFTVILD